MAQFAHGLERSPPDVIFSPDRSPSSFLPPPFGNERQSAWIPASIWESYIRRSRKRFFLVIPLRPPAPIRHSHESGNPEDGYRLPPGHPPRRPGESRGLGERYPLDSGFRRNDEGAGSSSMEFPFISTSPRDLYTPLSPLHPLVIPAFPRHSCGSRNQADDHPRRNVIRPAGTVRSALRRRAAHMVPGPCAVR